MKTRERRLFCCQINPTRVLFSFPSCDWLHFFQSWSLLYKKTGAQVPTASSIDCLGCLVAGLSIEAGGWWKSASCQTTLRWLGLPGYPLKRNTLCLEPLKTCPRLQEIASKQLFFSKNFREACPWTTALEKDPVQLSGTSRFFPWASNFLFLIAPRARAQVRRLPAKFLIAILRRKGKF